MYFKFLNDLQPHAGVVKAVSKNVIRVATEETIPTNLSGFRVYRDYEMTQLLGDYRDYTTMYDANRNMLSNDGSVYVNPEPSPEPEPYVPTLEEVIEDKVQKMNMAQQTAIASGIDVVLTDGHTEHFTLTQYDQTSLIGLQAQVEAGTEQIPWHNSNEEEHCKFYSNADMAVIVEKAMEYVTYHVTYFRDLRIYVRALQDKGEARAIAYGFPIPAEYKSDVLKAMEASA